MSEPSKQLSLPPAPPKYPKYKDWGKSSAERFTPHVAKPVVTVDFVIPKVFFTPQVMRDMYHIVDLVDGEVGWFGIVEEIGNDYLVKEVLLPRQVANHGTCELTPQGVASIATDIIRDRDDGLNLVNSIRFWGHSHHNMGTSASTQDESQLAEAAEQCEDYFIRAILNKKGRMEVTVYAYCDSLVFKDVEWLIYDENEDARRDFWQEEVDHKVKPIEHQQGNVTVFNGNTSGHYIDIGHGRKRWVPNNEDDRRTDESLRRAWGDSGDTDENVPAAYTYVDGDGNTHSFDNEGNETVVYKSPELFASGESVDGLLHPLEND